MLPRDVVVLDSSLVDELRKSVDSVVVHPLYTGELGFIDSILEVRTEPLLISTPSQRELDHVALSLMCDGLFSLKRIMETPNRFYTGSYDAAPSYKKAPLEALKVAEPLPRKPLSSKERQLRKCKRKQARISKTRNRKL